MLPVEFRHQLADELVHVFDVVGVELIFILALLAIGRAHDRAMNVRHRIVEEERLVLVLIDEIDGELVHQIGQVFSLRQIVLLAIDRVRSGLVAPIAAAAGEDQVLVETPLAGAELNLAPLADAAGHVAGFLEHGGNHHFAFRTYCHVALIAVLARCGTDSGRSAIRSATGHTAASRSSR